MTSEPSDLALLAVALDQAADLLGRVGDDDLSAATPCTEWTVGDLVDHLVNAPANFTTMMRGEQPDWGAPPPHVGADRETRFRTAGDGLVEAWRSGGDGDQPSPLDWQLAELAVHTWDLATAVHEPTDDLDPAVAERGLSFMQQGLTDDNRGPVFGPEQPAPPDADAYTRIAAFAGRQV
jgi:uncharacterized protein (TIGR03086 family)